ncbi:MAG: toll/interleukin-1 receptor domain-containing protein [Candidatus Gastranaerophilales bacterium]
MFFTKNELYGVTEGYKITESRSKSLQSDKFDIFLSHSYDDKNYIYKLKSELESMGLTVYVDWIVDSILNRNNVTKQTAMVLRQRMKQSNYLLYASSTNSNNSKWMPWELGFFDGYKGKVGIIPIVDYSYEITFEGQEYLSLYECLSKDDLKKLALKTKLSRY